MIPFYWLVVTGFVCFYAGMALLAILTVGSGADAHIEVLAKENAND